MKKISPLALLSTAALVGAAIAACTSFSSGPDNGTGGMSGGGTGGTPVTGAGGTPDTTGAGGMPDTTGAGGSTTGAGGATAAGGTTGGLGGKTGAGGSAGATGTGGATGAGGAVAANLPCDILNAAGNTCVAAHSTTRQLYSKYTGPLYQVCKGATQAGPMACLGGTAAMMDIPQVNGYANAAVQDTFCAGAACSIYTIYDQSGNGNFLRPSPRGGNGPANNPAVATALKLTVNGHEAYGVYIRRGQGYRAGCNGCAIGPGAARGAATGDQPETEYMVTSQSNLINGCCFDYGNAETTSNDDGNGTMEAVYFGGGVAWDLGAEGGRVSSQVVTPNGWVEADLENGLFAGFSTTNPSNTQTILTNTALHFNYVTALIVGDSCTGVAGCGTSPTAKAGGRFAIYGGDATSTNALKTMYDGIRPTLNGYVPMKKQGSIILGTGGDNSNQSEGYWYEGVMASGAATVATITAVQSNIAAAKYGK